MTDARPGRHTPAWLMAICMIAALSPVRGEGMSLTLSQAERTATERNYGVRLRQLDLRTAKWDMYQAIGGYLPSANYSLDYLRLDPETALSANFMTQQFTGGGDTALPPIVLSDEQKARMGFVYEDSWKHAFTFSQPITNGGIEFFSIAIARNARQAASLLSEAERQSAIYAIRRAYFDAVAAREFTELTEEQLEWTRANHAKAKVRYEVGTVPITDLLQWEADVAQREGELLEALAAQRTGLLMLYQTMGADLAQADTATTLEPFEQFEQWYDRGMQPTDGTVDSNLAFQAQQTSTRIAKNSTGIAIGQMLPKLNAFASYGWPSWDEIRPPNDTRSWTVGVNASVPLFAGFRNAAGYKKSSTEYQAARVAEEQTESMLQVDLERIAAFYRAAYGKVVAARKQTSLMDRQLEIMQKRYETGLVDQTQLTLVELNTRSARLRYISTLFECLLLETEYRNATGQLEVSQ
jgi:outer membrane protein